MVNSLYMANGRLPLFLACFSNPLVGLKLNVDAPSLLLLYVSSEMKSDLILFNDSISRAIGFKLMAFFGTNARRFGPQSSRVKCNCFRLNWFAVFFGSSNSFRFVIWRSSSTSIGILECGWSCRSIKRSVMHGESGKFTSIVLAVHAFNSDISDQCSWPITNA